MAKYTNDDLAALIQDTNKRFDKFQDETRKDIKKFSDFMIVQLDRQKRGKGAASSRDWVELAKQFLVTAAVALGICGLILQIVLKLIER